MHKSDIVNIVAARTEINRDEISLILDTAIDVIIDSVVEGRKVSIKCFGYFEARERVARKAYDKFNNQKYMLPARKYPVFCPSDIFRAKVKAGRGGL